MRDDGTGAGANGAEVGSVDARIEAMRDAATQLLVALNLVDELRKDAAAEGIPLQIEVGGGMMRLSVDLPQIPHAIAPKPWWDGVMVGVGGVEIEARNQALRRAEVAAELVEQGADGRPPTMAEVIARTKADVEADMVERERAAAKMAGDIRVLLDGDVALPDPEPVPEVPLDPCVAAPLKSGPWSDAEMQELKGLLAQGCEAWQIAASLHRSVQGVGAMIGRLNRAGRPAEVAPVAPEPEPEPEPEPRPAPPPEAERFDVRALRTRLDQLGFPLPWTPAKDLKLAETIAAGDGVGNAAALLRIQRDKCLLRWNQLCPEKGIDQQTMLLDELRRRAGAAK